MRRIVVPALCSLMLLLAPPRADAYFWDWIDDLSGPRFHGTTIQWRALCKDDDQLRRMIEQVEADAFQVERAAQTASAPNVREAYQAAWRSFLDSAGFLRSATTERDRGSLSQASTLLEAAYASRRLAQFQWRKAVYLQLPAPPGAASGESQEVTDIDGAIATQSGAVAEVTRRVAAFKPSPPAHGFSGLGVIVSACTSKPKVRRRVSLDVNVTWGKDHKNSTNEMTMAGPALTINAASWLDLGVGAGVAWFSSTDYPSFKKAYIEPVRIDLRPFDGVMRVVCAVRQCPEEVKENGFWRLVVIRWGLVTFPGGFEPGSFGLAQLERFPAERVQQRGFYVDVEPVLRHIPGLR